MDGKDAGDMRSAAQCRAGILVCHDGTLREDEQLCVRKAVMGLRAVFPFARVLNVGCGRWGGAMSDALPKGTENEEGPLNKL